MKDFLIKLAFLTILLVIFPAILIAVFSPVQKSDVNDNYIKLYDKATDKIIKISFEDYVFGVVCAEMPASFHEEALKAQAVAARTYALYKISNSDNAHKDADICTDFSHCQAYETKEILKKKWGKNYNSYCKKIKKAVGDTKGEYMSFAGKPINALFHSCSNGKTENASEVWGGDVAYLKSVESPGDFEKKDYMTKVSFNKDEFLKILKEDLKVLPDDSFQPIEDIKKSEGGNVIETKIYGVQILSKDLRRIFNLKSTAFDVVFENDVFMFTVYGNGHGVGMSQYGANGFAKDGMKYDEILSHYYSGIEIKRI